VERNFSGLHFKKLGTSVLFRFFSAGRALRKMAFECPVPALGLCTPSVSIIKGKYAKAGYTTGTTK
jgi:hypothetical protein